MRYQELLGFTVLLALSGCNRSTPQASETTLAAQPAAPANAEAADPHAGLSNYEVDRVDQLLAEKKITPVDANDEDTRKEYGMLPGAVTLTSASAFAASELPADKTTELVFYCGSARCTSAPKAATRAKSLGYEKVHVMRDGIRGWVQAGKKVELSS